MKFFRMFALAEVIVLFSLLTAPPCAARPSANTVRSHYDVAAFVWPSYHPDDRAKIFWPDGIGEWQTVISSTARFEGHQQPRRPLWGLINEADPYVAEMEISAAADHGVNVFIFDWYWYDGQPFLEGHLNDGYLKARNNDRVKFYLMWANHDVGMIWDKRNADDAFNGKNVANIWEGGVDRRQFDIIVDRVIKNYFRHPSYYKIDGKPVFMLYDLPNLVEGLGGIQETKLALDSFRRKVREAGFPGLELQMTAYKPSMKLKISGVEYNQSDLFRSLGFDSTTNYQFVHLGDLTKPYNEVVKDAVSMWAEFSVPGMPKYYPHVSIGWDASPRAKTFTGPILKDNTPANFESALREAKAFIDAHPNQAPLITINSWNEWTETSYLQPDTQFGYQYLEAVRRVFVSEVRNNRPK